MAPSLNHGAFFPQFRKSLGDILGKEQELKQTPPLAGNDSGLVVAAGNGVKTTSSLSLVLHHKGQRQPLNILPLAVIVEQFVPGVEALTGWFKQSRVFVMLWGCLVS